MRFKLRSGEAYEIKALPFGLSSSPCWAYKLSKVILSWICNNLPDVSIVCYVDDIAILGSTKLQVEQAAVALIDFLTKLGIQVNSEKSMKRSSGAVRLPWTDNQPDNRDDITSTKQAEAGTHSGEETIEGTHLCAAPLGTIGRGPLGPPEGGPEPIGNTQTAYDRRNESCDTEPVDGRVSSTGAVDLIVQTSDHRWDHLQGDQGIVPAGTGSSMPARRASIHCGD